MTISSSASTGTIRARWRRVVFLLTTVAVLGLGLSVAAYSGAFGTQEAGALQTGFCGVWDQPQAATQDSLGNFSMRAQYSDNTYLDTVEPSGDHVTIYVRPRISGVTGSVHCNPESVHIQWRRPDLAGTGLFDIDGTLTCKQMNLTSTEGNTHTFDDYKSGTDSAGDTNVRFSSSDAQGCIYWDFWNDWPYQASISLEGRTDTARLFDSHATRIPIDVYEARIRICRATADAQTRDFPVDHDCSAWSGYLKVDLVNDSAGPSGL